MKMAIQTSQVDKVVNAKRKALYVNTIKANLYLRGWYNWHKRSLNAYRPIEVWLLNAGSEQHRYRLTHGEIF
jgi:hypothetical protein